MLKLIIDCTAAQSDEIEADLEQMHQEGLLDFGVHQASHAIMTCVPPQRGQQRARAFHGRGWGSLWSAARGLKQRMSRHAA